MPQPDPNLDAIADALLSIPDTVKRHEAFLELADLLDPPTPREELVRWAYRQALDQMSLNELSAALLALSREGVDVVRDRLDGFIPPDYQPAPRGAGTPTEGPVSP